MRSFFIVILLGIVQFAFGQNMIINSSFEEHRCCPDGYSQFHCTQYWLRPTRGTSDFFSSCENRFYSPEAKVPNNFIGHQYANTGIAYAGLYTFYKDDYREYILSKLPEPLKPNQIYCLSFYVSLADTVGIALKSIGVHFSDTIVGQDDYFPLDLPHIDMELSSGYLMNKSSWTKLSYNYKAKGGEQIMIIGNFKNNAETDTISARDTHTGKLEDFVSYYYVDDICLGELKADNTCVCVNNNQPPIVERTYSALEIETTTTEEPKNIPKIGERFILKNIHFEFDKATLLPVSNDELNKLYDLLQTYPSMKIKISGHTDSKGNHRYNLALSESRALAVYTYLIKKGITSSRLEFEGLGKTQPIATNETDEGRQMNRRVEFEVTYIGIEMNK